jgi:RNA polymerase sigma-70 factor (ECF subfamily)
LAARKPGFDLFGAPQRPAARHASRLSGSTLRRIVLRVALLADYRRALRTEAATKGEGAAMTCPTVPRITADLETDETTFGRALAGMRQDLFRWAWALTRDHASADDLVQTTIERAIRARLRFRAGTNLSAWLGAILRNSFLDAYRKHRTFVSAELRRVVAPPVESELLPWDLLETSDLWDAASRLRPKERLMFELAYRHKLSHRDIARQLGVKVSTIGTSLFRARAKLRVLLDLRFQQRVQQRLGSGSMAPPSERLREPLPSIPAAPDLSWPAAGTSAPTETPATVSWG